MVAMVAGAFPSMRIDTAGVRHVNWLQSVFYGYYDALKNTGDNKKSPSQKRI
jgi:hypothetical protein